MSVAIQQSHQVTYSDKDDFLRAIALDLALKPTTVRIAVILISFVNRETGLAWPGHEKLSEMSGVAKRTVIRGLQELEEAGYITVHKGNGRGKPNHYSFNFEQQQLAEVVPLQLVKTSHEKGDKIDITPNKKGDKWRKKGCQNQHQKGDTRVTLTNNNITNKNNQSELTQKFTLEELRELAWSFVHSPVQPIPPEKQKQANYIVDRTSPFWIDWLFSIQCKNPNPLKARAEVRDLCKRGWLSAKAPYPKLLEGTPRALAFDAASEYGLSGGASG